MRIVATAAGPFADRFAKMLILGIGDGPLLQGHGVGVASPADFALGTIEQLGGFTAVRVVAVQTAGTARQGPMDLLFGKRFFDHGLVTLQAQGRRALLDRQRVGGCRLIVALPALFLGHRGMHGVVKYFGLVGPVGIMAGVAVAFIHFIIQMAPGKHRPVGFMATRAKGGCFVLQ